MAITEQEKKAFADEIRAELERDHQRRLDNLERQRGRQKERSGERHKERMEMEKGAIREEMKKAFYEEKGYKLYTDSTGRQHWLTPEEFAFRTSRKRRRIKRPRLEVQINKRVVLLYAGAVMIAVIVGLAMT